MAVDAVVTEEIIIQEILIRLPIKSMVRCRSVCKSWLAQLYNPNFLFHLNRRSCSVSLNPPQRHDDNDYLIFMNNFYNIENTCPYGLSILGKKLSETCIINDYAPYPLSTNSPLPINRYNIDLVGCINGLVCIIFYFEDIHQFVLWNPTIRLFKKILVPEQYPLFMYGFGWDSVTNDYKLITKPFDNENDDADDEEVVLSAGVYSCKTDCWSSVDSVSMDSSVFIGWQNYPCVIVNGSPYWYNFIDGNILKFDITSSEFTCLKAPSLYLGIYTNLINLNDCLASIIYSRYHAATKVYRYDEQHNIWTHMYTLDKYMNHRDIIIHCFKYGGEIVFHGRKHLYMYDHNKSWEIKSRHRRCLGGGGCLAKSRKRKHHGSHNCEGHIINGFSYTPSLVALPGMKTLHR